MNPPPLPFGDPTQVQHENRGAVGKGVFLGCGGCALIVVAFGLFIASIFGVVVGSMRKSDVSEQAMAKVNASPQVRAVLGSPIEQGWLPTGKISVHGDRGTAEINFSVTEPKGGGTVHLEATKDNGVWAFHRLIVVPESTGKPIDLLALPNVT
ncbi:MAG: hypothetical protein JWO08_3903 [Verrucomicrobiaceae bacterium]|nr:hypothetical protein [Verrucomicrobiaceae bacterium]